MPSRAREAPLSAAKRRVFALIALLFPFVLLGVVEGTLRVFSYGAGLSLFERTSANSQYLHPSHDVAQRFFPNAQRVPRASADSFLVNKPVNSFRVFALGESSTAGFPYPPKAMFTREIAAALHDVLPADSIEVINLGIEATNTYALADLAGEILDQHPDAILIYSGHNEFYGAPGAASLGRLAPYPWLVRASLKLERFRTFQLLRNAIMRGTRRPAVVNPEIGGDGQMIELGSELYRTGSQQFEKNLSSVVGRFRRAGIPVFVGSLVSNLRDQPPLVTLATGGRAGQAASASFSEGRSELAAGDQATAKKLLIRARDLDEIRFRAPTDFNSIIQRVVAAQGATYVPIEEEFSRAAQGGVPGHDLILEHVHPNSRGYALMGKVFFSSIQSSGILKKRADFSRLKSWLEYEKNVGLTEADRESAAREVQNVVSRWPFVPYTRSAKQQLGDSNAR